MAAPTITITRRERLDRESVRDGSLAMGVYETNGVALTPANLTLDGIHNIQISPSGGYIFEYDYTNQKVKAYYGDNNNASDGPLIEVPNDTDLSLSAVRFRAFGY